MPFTFDQSPLSRWWAHKTLSDQDQARIHEAVTHLNSAGFDPWGLHLETVRAAFPAIRALYRDYFRVQTTGIEKIPPGRALLIANHGGQIPIDGMLVSVSTLLEGSPARIARGMIERWVPTLPFVSSFFNRLGQVVGDVNNCVDLLNHDQCVLVFPEGVRGSGKTIFERYQLQKFGTGFIHMAIKTKSPIVPVAVIGCEEIYPSISGLKPLAKLFGAPYLPVPITGLIPLPTKVTLRFGDPIYVDDAADLPESEIEKLSQTVRKKLQHEINVGLVKRGEQIFTGSGV